MLPLDLSSIKQKNMKKKHGRTQSSTMAAFFGGSNSASGSLKSMPVPPSIVTNIAKEVAGVAMQRTSSANSFFDSSELAYTPSTPSRSAGTNTVQYQKFPLQKAYAEILQRCSVHSSPYEKLRALYDFELLVIANMGRTSEAWDPHATLPPSMPESPMVQTHKHSSSISPEALLRYDATDPQDLARLRLEALDISKDALIEPPACKSGKPVEARASPGTDKIVEELQKLLRDPELRPKTLFRDLQYIASFIPANILNMTDEGKVFWDVGLAALAVKRELTDAITKYAASITSPATESSEKVTISKSPPEGSLEDAVKLFTIAAKERDPTAMRELAVLQLKRPELVDITIPPLSDPSAIFAAPASNGAFKYPGIRRVSPPTQNTTTDNDASRIAKTGAARIWLKLAAAEGDRTAEKMLLEMSV